MNRLKGNLFVFVKTGSAFKPWQEHNLERCNFLDVKGAYYSQRTMD
jgi:hypothetical protein